MKKIIKNGMVVTAEDTFQADILIDGEKIASIGHDFLDSDAEVHDAEGCYVLPGGVDVHTHLDLPMAGTISSDDHYTGHKAAAFGGTTTVLDFISQDFDPLIENVRAWRKKAAEKAAVDYSFHMNISRFDETIAKDLALLPGEGITSVKVFTAYNNRLRLQDGDIFKLMRIAKKHGLLTMVHAENGDIIDVLIKEALASGHTSPIWHARTRPAWGAVEASLRVIAFSAQSGAPLYLVHMNAGGEVDQLAYGRSHGLPVMGETCPQYLYFNEDALAQEDGSKFVCSPPLRHREDQERLWAGLTNGTIQVISTDHCPFFFDGETQISYEGTRIKIKGKELGRDDFSQIPNGLPGVGDRLPILWTYGVGKQRITLNQFVALACTNPAKIFGMYPQKGSIQPGADADIVIWDPEKTVNYGVKIAKHRTDYNLFEGWQLKGFPVKVFLRGKLIVDGSSWHGSAGFGQFIYRKAPEVL